ncbi:putative serine/threonine-protein kinase PknB [Microbacterium faecale]|uniref:non-specific serine/threonine protein kinase n=1 Tax=Microbacterium faecale TaxID=1804630 RepID=A0A916Y1Q1_9MICO|nr:Stk1 family PASTA domain-containing Ser/Thr kinase [Microbacterium faecale]GGD27473.1 putative serine/threonine-protein kinase PknB [Microbacterium faecale]
MTDDPTEAIGTPTQAERILSGRYRVDALIGRGGMASVYRGYDLTLGRTIAIKILRSDLAQDNTFRTRFRLEAQAASRMAHPSIVRVYDAGEDLDDDGSGGTTHTPYIIMELVRGRLLKDVIAAGPVSADDAAGYIDGILEALEYSHRAGVVHRDIKPANVMIDDDGQIKVMDFGIARAVSDTSATVAETTTILGTAAYFSPEQAQGAPVDARADLYSTGVVLYELLAGRPPFVGNSPVAVASQHVRDAPTPPTQVGDDVPAQLDPVVLRALAKDPAQRFPDAATFREALDAALDGRAPSQRQLTHLTEELYGAGQRARNEVAHTLTQLSSETGTTRTQSGPPVAWVWAAIALVIALIIAVGYWVVRTDPLDLRAADTVDVANVSGWSLEAATAELEGRGLEVTLSSEPSDTVAADIVIGTDPAAGVSLGIGATVEIVVSAGPLMAEIPELEGDNEDAARAAIDGVEGLMLGRVFPQNEPGVERGTVLNAQVGGSDVEPGDEVLQGSSVDLTVATGRVTVADLTGFTIDAAKRILEEELQLDVEVEKDNTCEESDLVTKQDPGVGDVQIDETVTLTHCSGDDDFVDPDGDEPGYRPLQESTALVLP